MFLLAYRGERPEDITPIRMIVYPLALMKYASEACDYDAPIKLSTVAEKFGELFGFEFEYETGGPTGVLVLMNEATLKYFERK